MPLVRSVLGLISGVLICWTAHAQTPYQPQDGDVILGAVIWPREHASFSGVYNPQTETFLFIRCQFAHELTAQILRAEQLQNCQVAPDMHFARDSYYYRNFNAHYPEALFWADFFTKAQRVERKYREDLANRTVGSTPTRMPITTTNLAILDRISNFMTEMVNTDKMEWRVLDLETLVASSDDQSELFTATQLGVSRVLSRLP